MKQENKYYTPTIEEFHVGFEYEVKYFKEWEKVILEELETSDSDGALHYHIPTEVSLGRFRVKYLDREDIESLGFQHDKVRAGENYGKMLSKVDDVITSATISIFKGTHTIVKHIWNDIKPYKTEITFKGTIKNKSELKKLLKQLGIW